MKVQADRFKPNSSSYGLEEVPGMQSPSWLTAALEHFIFKNTEDMKRCSFVLLPHRVVDSWLGEGFFPNHFILCCQKFNILGSFLTLHDSLLFIPMLILQRLSSCFGRFLYRRKKKKSKAWLCFWESCIKHELHVGLVIGDIHSNLLSMKMLH